MQELGRIRAPLEVDFVRTAATLDDEDETAEVDLDPGTLLVWGLGIHGDSGCSGFVRERLTAATPATDE